MKTQELKNVIIDELKNIHICHHDLCTPYEELQKDVLEVMSSKIFECIQNETMPLDPEFIKRASIKINSGGIKNFELKKFNVINILNGFRTHFNKTNENLSEEEANYKGSVFQLIYRTR